METENKQKINKLMFHYDQLAKILSQQQLKFKDILKEKTIDREKVSQLLWTLKRNKYMIFKKVAELLRGEIDFIAAEKQYKQILNQTVIAIKSLNYSVARVA